MSMWDRIFWIWFILAGIAVVVSLYITPSLSSASGLLLGVVIIATGMVKLADEVAFKELKKVNVELVNALHWIREGLNKIGNPTNIEDNEQHKFLAKKIMELEGRVNRVSKALTEEIVDIKTKQSSDFVEVKEEENKAPPQQ